MEHFLIYLLQSGICLTFLYVCIKAFLSNETFFRVNRFTLLIGVAVCFCLPLIKVSIHKPTMVQQSFIVMEELLTSEYIPVESNAEQPAYSALWIIFLAGAFINLALLMKSAYAMFEIIRKGRKLSYSNQTLVVVSQNITPFSWGKYIVLSAEDYHHNPAEIICHEQAHICHFHCIDILFMEFLLLLQWFNPIMWLLVGELKDIHEYQADRSVLQSGIDAKKYQLLLVKKAVGVSSHTLANNFNHSKIKKRITMMLKEKSNQWALLKLLLLLPFGILSVYAFAQTQVNEQTVNESVVLFSVYESNHFFQESPFTPEMNAMQEAEPQDPAQQKQPTNPPFTIRIRQDSNADSIIFGRSQTPLYIVDEKETDTIDNLLPENIRSIAILKDHTANELYGEKGKNGVVIITTKHNQSVDEASMINSDLFDLNRKSATDVTPLSHITIRGRTLDNAQSVQNPLYMVDGKEVDNIDNLSADKIESISILKDHTANELYGEKGKNGVVIITTKQPDSQIN